MTSKSAARCSGGAHHESPHPAEIAEGTGIMRPGKLFSVANSSNVMAAWVFGKVMTVFGVFCRAI